MRDKRFVRYVDETPEGDTVHFGPEGMAAIEQQLGAFREKFGREPGPHDPIFFDPDEDEPTPLTAEKFRRIFLDAAEKVVGAERGLELFEYMGSDEHREQLRAEGVRATPEARRHRERIDFHTIVGKRKLKKDPGHG